jgi:hypothetical protein
MKRRKEEKKDEKRSNLLFLGFYCGKIFVRLKVVFGFTVDQLDLSTNRFTSP